MEDPRLPSMRAADADRERVLEIMRQAHAEGRLSTPEFYERLDGVYLAKTYAELDEFVVDLPVGASPAPSPPPTRTAVARPAPGGLLAQMPKELRGMWVTWATVASINALIWLIISVASPGDAPYFWPIWVAGPWGVVNAGITFAWWANRRTNPDPPGRPPGAG